MAEAVAAAVAWATEGEVVLTALEAFAAAATIELVVATAYNNFAKRRARDKMRQAHNDSLRDRYVMGRAGSSARRIVLGRQRVSGDLIFLKSYGTNLGKITGVLPLSAEEIDGVEAIYFDGEQVVLDGSGNVTGLNRREYFSVSSTGATFTLQSAPKTGTVSAVAKYGTTSLTLGVSVAGKDVTVSGASSTLSGQVTISYQPDTTAYVPTSFLNGTSSITTDGSGNGSTVLPLLFGPLSGSVHVVRLGNLTIDSVDVDATSLASVTGNTVSIAGAEPSTTYIVNYQYTDLSRARIRVFTGAPGQVADPALIAALPGVWTSAHVGNAIAYIVFEFDYDPDAFSGGLVNISALVRGSKIYDPRTGLTAWSENPALLTRHVAMHWLGGRLPAARVNDSSFIAAANICDTTTSYVVNGRTYTRPRYTAGLVLTSGTRADDVIQDLCEAMGGDRAFTDGQLRVKAGAWATPLQTLDESWLIAQGGAIQSRRRRPPDEIVNIYSGSYADEESDYQVVPYPTVRSETYITEDGEQLPEDLDLNAVTFSAQAQQIAAQKMRRKRFGRRISVTCNQKAFDVEWGDNLYVNLPTRFGYVNLPCEVLDVSFTIDGGISLTMEEIGPEIWAVSSSYAEVLLPPNVFSPSPLEVAAVAGLTASSADAVQVRNADGTVVQRIRVSWTAPADGAVLAADGGTEIRYGLASWPESQWISRKAEGGATQIDLVGVQQAQVYLIKARHFNALVNGKWSLPILHVVSGRSILVGTSGLQASAATQVRTANASGVSVTGYGRSYNAGGPIVFPVSNTWTTVVSDTFTPVDNCEVELTLSGYAAFKPGSHVAIFEHPATAFSMAYTVNGGANSGISSFDQAATTGMNYTVPINFTKRVSLTGGVAATLAFRLQKAFDDDTMTVTDLEMRITAIYR